MTDPEATPSLGRSTPQQKTTRRIASSLRTDDLKDLSKKELKKLVQDLRAKQLATEVQTENLRHTIEEQRARHEQHLQFYDLAPVGFLRMNERGDILEANYLAARMLGIPKTQIPKKKLSVTHFLSGECLRTIEAHLHETFSSPHMTSCEITLTPRSKKPAIPLRIQSVPRFSEGDTPECLTTLFDISELKVLEENRRLAFVVEQNRNSVITLSNEGRINWVNSGFSRLTGLKATDVLGERFCTILKALHAPDDVIRRVDRSIATGSTFECEVPIVHHDGHDHWMFLSLSPVSSNAPTSDGFIAIQVDVSKHKQAEAELESQRAQVIHSGRLAALGEMAAAIAHEIGQPLQIIHAASNVMEQYLGKKSKVKDRFFPLVTKINKQVNRASGIIQNMRNFSRQDTSTDETITDLCQPVSDAIGFFEQQFRLEEIDIRLRLPKKPPLARVNPQKFQQIVVNLLSNARHAVLEHAANTQGAYQKRIRVRLLNNSKRSLAMLEVEDNGCGMSEDVRHRCLDPFFTSKPVGQGTGLGLSILHSIVKEIGGSVEVESELGRMSLFRINLPLETSE